MLKSLHIKNFVLIDELIIEFSEHLTTITGETGAGKSILLGALNLILGQRADTSLVSDEKKTCVIEGAFDLSAYQLASYFESEGIDYYPHTILRREIRSNGKSRAFINDSLVNLTVLKSLSDQLIDIHEQFDSHFLTDRVFQFQVVDSLARQIDETKAYQKLYTYWKSLQSQLIEQKEKSALLSQKKEFLEYQLNEFIQIAYQEGEFEALEKELDVLKNAESISELVQLGNHLFQEAENNILDQIRQLIQQVNALKIPMPELKVLKERLESNYIELEDLYSEISQLEDAIELESGRSEWIENRIAEIFKVLKKHQLNDAEDLPRLAAEMEEELLAIQTADSKSKEIDKEIKEVENRLSELAEMLSAKRQKQCKPIQESVLNNLAMLNLENAKFEVRLEKKKELNEYGRDELKFLFSANPGMPLSPVEKVASGGETSRLALSVKALVAKSIPLPTIVFDEIDAAVSGSAADKMGKLLHRLGRSHQVICITHSPQVASRADRHFIVYKEIKEHRTETHIRKLEKDGRIHELAIMMSSDPPSDTALENARYLLEKKESN